MNLVTPSPITDVLIVAAGASRRLGSEVPKQYQRIGGKAVLRLAAEAFAQHPAIRSVQVVVQPSHLEWYSEHMQGLALPAPVEGGATRQHSVRAGLEALAARETPPRYVLIHDAARPFVTQELITQVIKGLRNAPAVIPALPVSDTLKHVEQGIVAKTVARDALYQAQTPQGFHFQAIFTAHMNAAQRGTDASTDDALLAEQAGLEVRVIPGSIANYKITTQEDLRHAASAVVTAYETRVGFGVDAHRLIPHTLGARRVMTLCGVTLPFEARLEGHSDADVGLHALVDALLGAMSEGDIGVHFPPSDPAWHGANSSRFVLHAWHLLTEKQGRIVNVDITLICERPRITEHRGAMIAHIAQLLSLEPHRVSVKATTTEKMGFTGRAEGIMAHAVASVALPVITPWGL